MIECVLLFKSLNKSVFNNALSFADVSKYGTWEMGTIYFQKCSNQFLGVGGMSKTHNCYTCVSRIRVSNGHGALSKVRNGCGLVERGGGAKVS